MTIDIKELPNAINKAMCAAFSAGATLDFSKRNVIDPSIKSDIELRTQADFDALREKTVASVSAALDVLCTENAQLRSLIAEMAENDTYETEYDGRMYSICHGCGAQDGEPHRQTDCLYVRARAAQKGDTK